jgi:hypothetical protein
VLALAGVQVSAPQQEPELASGQAQPAEREPVPAFAPEPEQVPELGQALAPAPQQEPELASGQAQPAAQVLARVSVRAPVLLQTSTSQEYPLAAYLRSARPANRWPRQPGWSAAAWR